MGPADLFFIFLVAAWGGAVGVMLCVLGLGGLRNIDLLTRKKQDRPTWASHRDWREM